MLLPYDTNLQLYLYSPATSVVVMIADIWFMRDKYLLFQSKYYVYFIALLCYSIADIGYSIIYYAAYSVHNCLVASKMKTYSWGLLLIPRWASI